MAESKSNLNNKIDLKTDPFDELCYYLDSIEKSGEKMAPAAPTNLVGFKQLKLTCLKCLLFLKN